MSTWQTIIIWKEQQKQIDHGTEKYSFGCDDLEYRNDLSADR